MTHSCWTPCCKQEPLVVTPTLWQTKYFLPLAWNTGFIPTEPLGSLSRSNAEQREKTGHCHKIILSNTSRRSVAGSRSPLLQLGWVLAVPKTTLLLSLRDNLVATNNLVASAIWQAQATPRELFCSHTRTRKCCQNFKQENDTRSDAHSSVGGIFCFYQHRTQWSSWLRFTEQPGCAIGI